jgi:SAM-dependent methyltransferase
MKDPYPLAPKPKFQAHDLSPAPCALVRRFALKLAAATSGLPVLDVACGSGRNAFPFEQLGCTVICMDKDLSVLKQTQKLFPGRERPGRILLHRVDLTRDEWPFPDASVGAIINIHFFFPPLFPHFARSLIPGGYLLFETAPGCGGNYRQLPKEDEIRARCKDDFDLEVLKEKRVGPAEFGAATVKLLARRKLIAPKV